MSQPAKSREVKILKRLPDGRNVATRQAVHGSAPCARTEVTGRWLGTAADSPCLDDSSRGDSRRRTREVKILMRLPVGKVQTADPMGVRIF